MSRELSLSVLDQSPVRAGGTAAQALRETVALAKATDLFGYARYWVAEHHNSPLFAGTAPEILVGQIAASTARIRVGSGGVMLSHYSALKVAEMFRLLSALYPGRIDLGIGRAPGSDQRTAVALAHPRAIADIREFPEQVADLVGFLYDQQPQNHPFAAIGAQPGVLPTVFPEVWLLGSSGYSAQLAAAMGLPFAFADFFGNAGDVGPRVAELYRQQFQPSAYQEAPRVIAAVHVTCAESDERAAYVGTSMKLAVAQMRTGLSRPALIDPQEASRVMTRPDMRQAVAGFTRHYIEGNPETVRRGLLAAAERYGTSELAIATNCFAYADRVRSYDLVAGALLGFPSRPTNDLV